MSRVLRWAGGAVGWYPFLTVRAGAGRGLKVSLRNSSADYTSGANEVPVQRAVEDHTGPGAVFYDIGANVGFFGMLAARRVQPDGRVYAFEPVPANVECVRANAARNRLHNLEVLPLAVGAEPGTHTLLLSAHPGGATISAADRPPDFSGTLAVETTTVDHLVEAGRILPPTTVKIDVEGAELDVIRGMTTTIERHRPVIICELDGPTAEGVGTKLAQLDQLLAGSGYGLHRLEASYRHPGWHVAHLVAIPGARQPEHLLRPR